MKHKEIQVLYIITKLELGGAQKVCLSLLEGLRQAGNTAILISGSQGTLVDHVQKKPHIFLLDSFKRELSWSNITHEVRTFFKLIKHIWQLKKQYPHLIVHTHSTKAGILGRWAAFLAGIKTRIHTVHGFAFHDHQKWHVWLPIYAVELFTSFMTTHFICVSSEDVKTGIRLFPFFAKKHSIIRAAVDWDSFYMPAKQTDITAEPFIFGTVSCFKKQKNIFDLLEAFAWVHKHNPLVRLEIIGDGELRQEIEFWIAQHKLEDVITLHSWQLEVAPIMITWHAFVLSSLWEGLPCAIVEARLLKLPVLSYNTGGIRDVIAHGENGFLYPQRNWLALAQGMLELTQQPGLYSKLQQSPDNLEDFNSKRMIEQHIRLYETLR